MVNRISNVIVLVVNLAISLVAYFALGKNELNDILYKYALSKAKKAWQKEMMLVTLLIFLALILLSMPMFNPSIR
jgi:hypothetical protein